MGSTTVGYYYISTPSLSASIPVGFYAGSPGTVMITPSAVPAKHSAAQRAGFVGIFDAYGT